MFFKIRSIIAILIEIFGQVIASRVDVKIEGYLGKNS